MQVHREDGDHLVVIEQILGGGCVPADMVPLTKDLQFKDVISAPTAAGHRRRQNISCRENIDTKILAAFAPRKASRLIFCCGLTWLIIGGSKHNVVWYIIGPGLGTGLHF